MAFAVSKFEIIRCGAPMLTALAWTAVPAANLKVEVADPQGRPLAEAVVYAIPVAGSAAAPDGVSHAVIDQVHKTFVPLVSVIRAGTEVRFPNRGRLIFASKSDGRNTHYFPRVFDTACVSCGFHYRSCYP